MTFTPLLFLAPLWAPARHSMRIAMIPGNGLAATERTMYSLQHLEIAEHAVAVPSRRDHDRPAGQNCQADRLDEFVLGRLLRERHAKVIREARIAAIHDRDRDARQLLVLRRNRSRSPGLRIKLVESLDKCGIVRLQRINRLRCGLSGVICHRLAPHALGVQRRGGIPWRLATAP